MSPIHVPRYIEGLYPKSSIDFALEITLNSGSVAGDVAGWEVGRIIAFPFVAPPPLVVEEPTVIQSTSWGQVKAIR